MRTSAAVSFALLGLAVATPVPQDIDFDAYNAIPILEDLSAPVGAAVSSTVTYDATAAASSVCILSKLHFLSTLVIMLRLKLIMMRLGRGSRNSSTSRYNFKA
jgi:hypothetical protein